MALINCVNCGEPYSETLKTCPHCNHSPKIFICPECGSIVGLSDKTCSVCGFDLSETVPAPASNDTINNEKKKALEDIAKTSDSKHLSLILAKLELLSASFDLSSEIKEATEKLESAKCLERNEQIIKNVASALSSEQDSAHLKAMIADLELVGNYKNSIELKDATSVRLEQQLYKEAVYAMENSSTEKDWLNASNLFASLNDYENSLELKEKCLKKYDELHSVSTAKRNKTKKIVFTAVASIVLAISVISILTNFIIPEMHYKKAENLFAAEEFSAAEQEYLAAGEYKDCLDKATVSAFAQHHKDGNIAFSEGRYVDAFNEFVEANSYSDSDKRIIDCGYALFDEEKYQDASDVFELCNDSDAKKHKEYADGMLAFSKEDYHNAAKHFKNAGSVKNAPDMVKESTYLKAVRIFNTKDYDTAKDTFKSVSGYKDADNYINICDFLEAEEYYKNGYLNSAKALYSEIPSDFSYNGISVENRLSTLNKYKKFVDMCGKWRATGDCQAVVTQIYKRTGSWDAWTTTYNEPYDFLSVTCVINDDGTVTVSGNAELTVHTDYSSLSQYLEPRSKTVYIDYRGKNVPNGANVASYSTLTFSNNKFKLVYNHLSTNESISFNYRYKSTWTYGNRVEAY